MPDEQKYAKLLELLAHYDYLLEQLEVTFSDGFQHLSRANFHNKDSIRGRYGSDYWDEHFKGSQFISCRNSNFAAMEPERALQYLAQFESDLEDEQEEDQLGKDRKESSLTNRKEGKKSKSKPTTTLYDPILMFGGVLSIPTSLRQCQSSFKGSIGLLIELVNCRRNIEQLGSELKS
ncbi:LAME_0G06656g1_1 [Lachancea meyersii CBS 8951]|uniref:Vacuolar ATPase assembly protein VMA22 n=1 Tax=Lachancea meyersii CBS 8951 TaxID=1266667 RepID=A0A1G4K7L8_9SACH|nr:LAME_0G06656g1_1 [Lachancea meyersii CBS 8951]